MSLVLEFVQQYIPYGFRKTPSGWLSGNCPMCIHNGQPRPDKRGRGGFFFDVDKFQYNCFNCGYKTGWSAGRHITARLQKLLEILGADTADIQRLKLQLATEQEVFQEFEYQAAEEEPIKFNWPEIELPKVSQPLLNWIQQLNFGYNDPENEYHDEVNCSHVIEFLTKRGFNTQDKRLYWCNNNTFQLNKRLFIPYVYKGKAVGYTARWASRDPRPDNIPKFYTQQPKDFVFNLDTQVYDRKYVIVVEGPMDALSIDGVAVTSNLANQTQCKIIEKLGKKIILCPDRDHAGARLVAIARKRKWAVSFPPWKDCKDASDAIVKYGKLFALKSIIECAETNQGKIKVLTKKYCN